MLISCFSACKNEPTPPNEEQNSDQTTSNENTSDTDDKLTITEYKTGEQIEIYLNSATKSIYEFIAPNPNSINIKDTDIVELQNGILVPKEQGITYVSCIYGA